MTRRAFLSEEQFVSITVSRFLLLDLSPDKVKWRGVVYLAVTLHGFVSLIDIFCILFTAVMMLFVDLFSTFCFEVPSIVKFLFLYCMCVVGAWQHTRNGSYILHWINMVERAFLILVSTLKLHSVITVRWQSNRAVDASVIQAFAVVGDMMTWITWPFSKSVLAT